MGLCPTLNSAVNGTAISASEYNANMNNLKSSVNAITAEQITDATITAAKMAAGVLVSSILSAQGDIVYANAANTLARLAKGAANTKLFMNAGATAPEWAVGYKIGTFTRDLSLGDGDVAYTGVGYKGSLAIFLAGANSNTYSGVGLDDGTNHFFKGDNDSFYSDRCMNLIKSGSGGVSVVLKTFDSDGITLTYTKNSSPTGTVTIFYLIAR